MCPLLGTKNSVLRSYWKFTWWSSAIKIPREIKRSEYLKAKNIKKLFNWIFHIKSIMQSLFFFNNYLKFEPKFSEKIFFCKNRRIYVNFVKSRKLKWHTLDYCSPSFPLANLQCGLNLENNLITSRLLFLILFWY